MRKHFRAHTMIVIVVFLWFTLTGYCLIAEYNYLQNKPHTETPTPLCGETVTSTKPSIHTRNRTTVCQNISNQTTVTVETTETLTPQGWKTIAE